MEYKQISLEEKISSIRESKELFDRLIASSVCEMNMLRLLAWKAKLSVVRIDDNTVDLYDVHNGSSLWLKEENREEHYIDSLFVDEGFYTDTAFVDDMHVSNPLYEVVDSTNLLIIICKSLGIKNVKPEQDYIGRGKQKRELCRVWSNAFNELVNGEKVLS